MEESGQLHPLAPLTPLKPQYPLNRRQYEPQSGLHVLDKRHFFFVVKGPQQMLRTHRSLKASCVTL
jgi:hypothetical protein